VKPTAQTGIFALFLIITIFFAACTKIDTTNVGDGLIPVVDNVNTKEMFLDVAANTFLYPDSTVLGRTEQLALGTITNDPLVGKTTASIFTQLRPLTAGFYPFLNHPDSVTVDSVILGLGLTATYGDTTTAQSVKVYEIDQASNFVLNNSAPYKINTPYAGIPVINTLLNRGGTSYSFIPARQRDKRYAFRGTVAIDSFTDQLRIPLNTALGNRFRLYDTSNAYKNDSAFNSLFRGFAIITDSAAAVSPGSLSFFRMNNANTVLYFYFRVKRNGRIDTTYTTFSFNSTAAYANIINRQRSGSEIASHLTPTPGGDSILYLQNSPGTFAQLNIPGLTTLSNRVIHRAELVVTQIPESPLNKFRINENIFLEYFDSINNSYKALQPDFEYNAGGYNLSQFGMSPLQINDPFSGQVLKQWRLNMTRYVQALVTQRKTNFPLRLYTPYYTLVKYNFPLQGEQSILVVVNTEIAAGRMKVGGGSHSKYKMRLRIIYSDIR
jgi:Domain of unknown function (DUF4270)